MKSLYCSILILALVSQKAMAQDSVPPMDAEKLSNTSSTLLAIDNDLTTALANANDIIDREAIYRGKWEKFREKSNDVIRATSSLKQFAAADRFNELTVMKDQLTSVFESLKDDGLAQSFHDLIKREFVRTDGAVKIFTTRYPGHNAFLRMAERERYYMSRDCKDPELSVELDCDLLLKLIEVKIDSESIKSMTEADLKDFEMQLTKVRNGPGVEAEVK